MRIVLNNFQTRLLAEFLSNMSIPLFATAFIAKPASIFEFYKFTVLGIMTLGIALIMLREVKR